MSGKVSQAFFGIVIGFLVLLPGCWSSESAQKRTGLFVINVLDKAFYDDCHIKGSINVPFDELEKFVDTLDPTAHIVLYCSNYMCTTSGYGVKVLKKRGFEHVWAYEGGTAEWYQLKLPVVGACTKSYLTRELPPSVESDPEVPTITAQELAQKMKSSEM